MNDKLHIAFEILPQKFWVRERIRLECYGITLAKGLYRLHRRYDSGYAVCYDHVISSTPYYLPIEEVFKHMTTGEIIIEQL